MLGESLGPTGMQHCPTIKEEQRQLRTSEPIAGTELRLGPPGAPNSNLVEFSYKLVTIGVILS